jgi:hypothetical protein
MRRAEFGPASPPRCIGARQDTQYSPYRSRAIRAYRDCSANGPRPPRTHRPRERASPAPTSRAGAPTPLAMLPLLGLPLPPPSSTHWPPSAVPLGARAWLGRYLRPPPAGHFLATAGASPSGAGSGGGSSSGKNLSIPFRLPSRIDLRSFQATEARATRNPDH